MLQWMDSTKSSAQHMQGELISLTFYGRSSPPTSTSWTISQHLSLPALCSGARPISLTGRDMPRASPPLPAGRRPFLPRCAVDSTPSPSRPPTRLPRRLDSSRQAAADPQPAAGNLRDPVMMTDGPVPLGQPVTIRERSHRSVRKGGE